MKAALLPDSIFRPGPARGPCSSGGERGEVEGESCRKPGIRLRIDGNTGFPATYERPILLDVYGAGAAGWAAKCQWGTAPTWTHEVCERGSSYHLQGYNAPILDPEVIGEGL